LIFFIDTRETDLGALTIAKILQNNGVGGVGTPKIKQHDGAGAFVTSGIRQNDSVRTIFNTNVF
jgi:hypothetical protein